MNYDSTVREFLDKFQANIEQLLNETLCVKTQCKGKQKNGKQCKHEACIGKKYCTKHAECERDVPNLLYHNHLPGKYCADCVACQTVGINS